MLPVPLAYKFVATALMLMEINYCASKLHLNLNLPIRPEEIKKTFIVHPSVMGFQGRFDTDNYTFVFAKSGRLRYICKLGHPYYKFKWGTQEFYGYYNRLTKAKSIVNTNSVYQIATNWLQNIDVNIPALESDFRPKVEQQGFNNALVPLFIVEWDLVGNLATNKMRPNVESPAITILIDGETGEMIHLRQEDDFYSRRPIALIKDMDKLLAIPDEEFMRYSLSERSNLVVRFSAVDFSTAMSSSGPLNTSVITHAEKK